MENEEDRPTFKELLNEIKKIPAIIIYLTLISRCNHK